MSTPAAQLAAELSELGRRIRALERGSQLANSTVRVGSEDLFVPEGIGVGVAAKAQAEAIELVLGVANADLDVLQTDLTALDAELAVTQTDLVAAQADVVDARAAAGTAQATADGKNTVHYRIDAPSLVGNTVDDLWFDIDDGNRLYVWTGAAWTSTQFGPGSLADLAVTSAKVAASAITTAQIAAGAVATGNLAANSVDSTKLAANSVIAGKIAAGTIVAADIAADTITGAQIAAGAITAGEIAALTITAAQIAVGTITAAQMTAGTITAASAIIADAAITNAKISALDAAKISTGFLDVANRIKAGAIAVEKLTVGSLDNMLQDPGFENPLLTNWQTSSDKTFDAVGGRNGLGALKIVNAAVQQASYNSPLDSIKADEFARYRISVWVAGTVIIPIGGAGIGSRARTADGTYSFPVFATNAAAIPANVWTRVSAVVVMPVNAVNLSIYVVSQSNFSTGTVWFDDASCVRMAAGELIVDGSVTTDKMTANTINGDRITANTIAANKIVANSITANELAANSIVAGKIAATAIDGMTVTGAIVRTAATGQRVELDGVTNAVDFFGVGSTAAASILGMVDDANGSLIAVETGAGTVFFGKRALALGGTVVFYSPSALVDAMLAGEYLNDRSQLSAPYAIAAGALAAASIAAGAVLNTAVTFPVGRFQVAPIINVTVIGDARDTTAMATAVTATGFTLVRGSNSVVARTIGANWQAVQMGATLAAG